MGRLKARLWGSGLPCCCCCGPLRVEGSLLDQSSPGGETAVSSPPSVLGGDEFWPNWAARE